MEQAGNMLSSCESSLKYLQKENTNKKEGAENYFQDQEKAMAHKRQVMKAFQSILFAPVTLTTSLATNTVKLFTSKKPSNSALNELTEQKSKGETVRSEDVETEEPTAFNLDDDSMTSMMSLELCVKLLHINKEALGRALVITYAIDSKRTRSSVEKIFVGLLRAIGEQHIKPAFKLYVTSLLKQFSFAGLLIG